VRLKQVTLSGFRAFATTTTVDLDADCVVISGANGQGKTSLLDAVFWALTGRLERLGTDEKLVSLYSETGGAYVNLTLSTDHGDLTIARRFDGQNTTLTSTLADRTIDGDELRRRFGRIVTPASELGSGGTASFATAMARSLYLQQDSIRDFINADSDDTRFRVVAELCGLGRITDLQSALQQERKAWTQATNQLDGPVSGKRARLADLRERASKLAPGDASLDVLASTWIKWWHTLKEILSSFTEPIPEVGSTAADTALDRAVRSLDAARLDVQRRRDSLADALKLHETIVNSASQVDVAALRAAVVEAEGAEMKAREALKTAEVTNLAIEHDVLQAKSANRELRTLAELALRHLGQTCPVCDQTFARDATIERLRTFLTSTPTPERTLEDLSPLVETLSELQQRTLSAKDALRKAESEMTRLDQLRADFQRRLEQLGIAQASPFNIRSELEQLMQDVTQRLSSIDSTRSTADQLSLSRARASELAQRQEVVRQLMLAEKDVAESERVLVSRERAGKVAASIAEEMREASLQIVDSELRRIEPLFQRIWAGIDPHPSLRAVELVSRLNYGKGRLSMLMRDASRGVSSESPEAVLSSSQQNALAVALFLTLNLGTQSLPLATTVLDDPFQSLDDINLLGLVDLLRRLSGRRQLIVTTHEHRFAQLLARKLRPIDEGQTTKLIEFDSWDRTAPLVTQREVGRESSPFRFVA
jgi:DNA repair exonuclease SbcCD ATPase subunit